MRADLQMTGRKEDFAQEREQADGQRDHRQDEQPPRRNRNVDGEEGAAEKCRDL
jgi:hypothetical protein